MRFQIIHPVAGERGNHENLDKCRSRSASPSKAKVARRSTASILFSAREYAAFGFSAHRGCRRFFRPAASRRVDQQNDRVRILDRLPRRADHRAVQPPRAAKMPGVSTMPICMSPSVIMPAMRMRVVCALGLTMEIFWPISRLRSVDFPAFGAPRMATNPARVLGLWRVCAVFVTSLLPFHLLLLQ